MKVATHFSNVLSKSAGLYRALFPHYCYLCEAKCEDEGGLCHRCLEKMPDIDRACQYCGVSVYNASCLCGRCAQQRPVYQTLFSPYCYEFPMDSLVKRMKYSQQLGVVSLLAQLFLNRLSDDVKPDYLIPVPMHARSLRLRGFNQSLELARLIGKHLKIPVLPCVHKTRRTEPQSSLPYKKRKNNLKGAFEMVGKITADAHVIVIDDVVTTGATVSEVARVLASQGVKKIDVWCMARTAL